MVTTGLKGGRVDHDGRRVVQVSFLPARWHWRERSMWTKARRTRPGSATGSTWSSSPDTGDMAALTEVDRIAAEASRPHDARNVAAARA
jgi:hypothetical protein